MLPLNLTLNFSNIFFLHDILIHFDGTTIPPSIDLKFIVYLRTVHKIMQWKVKLVDWSTTNGMKPSLQEAEKWSFWRLADFRFEGKEKDEERTEEALSCFWRTFSPFWWVRIGRFRGKMNDLWRLAVKGIWVRSVENVILHSSFVYADVFLNSLVDALPIWFEFSTNVWLDLKSVTMNELLTIAFRGK